MEHGKTALVLGATGGIGGEMSNTLLARGWRVRALTRDVDRSDLSKDMEWLPGDAMRPADVVAAASGASLIVHAVNPPGYRRWSELVLPMLDSSIAAARQSGALLLLPGTIYNYGPDAWPDLQENAPQHPQTRKGAIRAEMERRLQQAAADGSVRSLIVRAGDFFGPRNGNNWFAMGMVKPQQPLTSIINPGRPGLGHQWAYLPDVAETMMQLVERRERLPACAHFHMNGHWDADGTHMVNAIRAAAGKPDLPVRRFPWWLLMPAAPFVPLMREMKEMRYLWQQPLRMHNDSLVAILGKEPHTPLLQAVRTTLIGLGCLPPGADAATRSQAQKDAQKEKQTATRTSSQTS